LKKLKKLKNIYEKLNKIKIEKLKKIFLKNKNKKIKKNIILYNRIKI
jgi:hypothetical protein